MPGSIFISYRRAGGAKDARAIFERLRRELGHHRVFIDLEGIAPGEDFVDALERQLDGCDALVVLIGPDWSSVTNEHGARRLDDENDFVRIEVGAALRRGVKVFPVLIDGALPPRANELPKDLRPLVRRQAVVLDYAKFDADVVHLARAIARALEPVATSVPPTPSQPPVADPPVAPAVGIESAVPTVPNGGEDANGEKLGRNTRQAAVSIEDQHDNAVRKPGFVQRGPFLLAVLVGVVALVWGGTTLANKQERNKAVAAGAAIYRDNGCGACHGQDGRSSNRSSFPSLNGSKLVSGPKADLVSYFANVGVKKDQVIMQAFIFPMSDESVASLGTYIRNAWDNQAADLITPEEVNAARKRRMANYVPSSGSAPASAEPLPKNELLSKGERVYSENCAACHQNSGTRVGPISPLAGSALVTGPKNGLIHVILNGANNGAMPGWKRMLTHEQVAAVATYIRNHWNNSTGDLVQASEVALVDSNPAAVPAASSSGTRSPSALYAQSCVACHATGVAGAPKLGDRAAWAPRIAKGIAALNASVINGKGAMAPRGGSDADDGELASVVKFMVESSR